MHALRTAAGEAARCTCRRSLRHASGQGLSGQNPGAGDELRKLVHTEDAPKAHNERLQEPMEPSRPGVHTWLPGVVTRGDFPGVGEGSSPHQMTFQSLRAGYIDRHKATEEMVNSLPASSPLTPRDLRWLNARAKTLWFCPTCETPNPRDSNECEECGYLQVVPPHKMVNWVCGGCLAPNRLPIRIAKDPQRYGGMLTGDKTAGSTTCRNCGAHRSKSLSGTCTSMDWVCKPCRVIVKGDVCQSCQETRMGYNEFDPVDKAGSWPCANCRKMNFKTNTKCRHCGHWK